MLSLRRAALALVFLTLTPSCDDPGVPAGSGGATTSTTGATGGGGAAGTTSTTTGGNGTGGAAGGTGGTTSTGGAGGAGGSATGGTGGTTSTGGAGGAGGGVPVDGYGAISGTCGVVNLDDIQSPDPSLFQSALDFTGRPTFDVSLLSPGGQAMYAAGNLNASSLYSEIFAYEMLYWCDGATFLKGEGEIVYTNPMGKKTDVLVEIDGAKVGVSVVRAESFPKGDPYPVSQAFTVLDGKLADILLSTANVAPEDAWEKQFLSVLAQTPEHALAIAQAYDMVNPTHKADTIVLITVTEGDDDFIYYNQ